MSDVDFDVVVAGGSVAGCTAAILLAQQGRRVAVLEQKAAGDQHYKQLCTHFIQPAAMPVLAELGLAHLYEPQYGTRTQAAFVTPAGLIDPAEGYSRDPATAFALNLERRVLDPALRSKAKEVGVEFIASAAVSQVARDGDGWQVGYEVAGARRQCRAQLVVAADGRQSRLAKQTGNPTQLADNQRAALFGYFSGIAAPARNRSIFILNQREMAFFYPLPHGRTLLSLYVEKERAERWRKAQDPLAAFLAYFGELEGIPSVAHAQPEARLLGYSDYPNQTREPVFDGIAFIGDAALSLDPMSGVGCGFALLSAQMLAQALAGKPLSDPSGLADYRARYQAFFPAHAAGIRADSLIAKDGAAQQRIYQTICADANLQQQYLALTGRLIAPAQFQRAYLQACMQARQPAAA